MHAGNIKLQESTPEQQPAGNLGAMPTVYTVGRRRSNDQNAPGQEYTDGIATHRMSPGQMLHRRYILSA
jgi:hypothetical protein